MSSHGATYRASKNWYKKNRRKYPRNRNRKRDDYDDGTLVDVPLGKVKRMAKTCEKKVSHKTYGAACAAKAASEKAFGKKFYPYYCTLCGCWHLTTHPWKKE